MSSHLALPDPHVIDEPAPLYLRRELLAGGMDDSAITRAVRSGGLVRVRHGCYTTGASWEAADARGRHLLLTRGVLARAGADMAASHSSAVLVHGGPTWRMPTDAVHVTRLDARAGRREAGVVQHRGLLLPSEVATVGSVRVTTPLRTAFDVMTQVHPEVALAVVNDLLHRGLISRAELLAGAESIRSWPGSLGAHMVLRLATPRCESVGESRFVYLCQRFSLPMPQLQVEVFDEYGNFIGRVDFAWPELGVFMEFDGREKYLKPWRPGESAADVVVSEKDREDELRRASGWRCLRSIWPEFADPYRLACKVGTALGVPPTRPIFGV